ncbi:MAG TPA: cupredoxin domain-containing protein, partial [Actinomycetota bacterium]|nr:cupredoxin domain-containing protein [Actinomycetota bacterium]
TTLFRGTVITGPGSFPYAVPPLKPGHYYFHCDIHPKQMNGTLIVGGPPGGQPSTQPTNVSTAPPSTSSPSVPPPGGQVQNVLVVAQNTAFDVKKIDLKGNSPVSLTLDNRDPFPHNLEILTSAGGSTIEKGPDPFSGPAKQTWTFTAPTAGTYYFQCIVHPQMNGKVVVT